MHNTTFKYRIITSKLSLILILISAITGCENQEEKDARRSECLDNYRQQHIQKCEAACEINPVDTYCVMTAGDNIIDSGCASTIKRMVPESNEDTSYQREKKLVPICKKYACSSDSMDNLDFLKASISACER